MKKMSFVIKNGKAIIDAGSFIHLDFNETVSVPESTAYIIYAGDAEGHGGEIQETLDIPGNAPVIIEEVVREIEDLGDYVTGVNCRHPLIFRTKYSYDGLLDKKSPHIRKLDPRTIDLVDGTYDVGPGYEVTFPVHSIMDLPVGSSWMEDILEQYLEE